MNLIDFNNNLTDKNSVHSYLPLYQELLSSIKDSAKNILEVGVFFGGSIKLWHDFFVNANIYGMDCIDNVNIEIFPELKTSKRIILNLSNDAYTEDVVKNNFLDKNISFDFLLDDGPHTLESMKHFIQLYSPLMTEKGILIIEDVQDIEWIDILKDITPEHLKEFIDVYDLRENKNRYDDIVFVINKNKS